MSKNLNRIAAALAAATLLLIGVSAPAEAGGTVYSYVAR